MTQEMKRRGCKGIGGIHWDEMVIKGGIVLCKRTRELVGFEDNSIIEEFLVDPKKILDDDNEIEIESDGSLESSISELSDTSGYSEYEDTQETSDLEQNGKSKSAKLICQFFYSSLEGDFSWPVASFPLHRINNKVLSKLVWQVCEALGNIRLDDNNRVQV